MTKKPANPAKPSKPTPKLTVKQRKFVETKIQQPTISDREAARQAGYKPSTVDTAARDIVQKPAVQEVFRSLFNKAITDEQLVKVIAAGLKAFDTEFAKHEGEITDQQTCIAWGERRAYAELACRLKGLLVGIGDALPGEIQITIRHIGSAH